MINKDLSKNNYFKINNSINIFIDIISENYKEKEIFNNKLNEFLINKLKDKNLLNSNNNFKYNDIKDNINEYIDEDGFKISNGIKFYNLFEDLSFGDFVISFPNPFYNLTSKNYKLNKNLDGCYYIYKDFVNLNTLMKNLDKIYLYNEKIAFLNVLIFYSNKYIGDKFINILKTYENNKIIILQNIKNKKIDYKSKLKLIEIWNKLIFDFKLLLINSFFEDNIIIDIISNEIKLKNTKNFNNKWKINDNFFKFLIKKVIILKFNRLGIFTRNTYNIDNSEILVILKCQNELIYERAEIDEIEKQLEIGKIDLLSLEPIDNLNRPYRLKKIENINKIKINYNEQKDFISFQKLFILDFFDKKEKFTEEQKVLKEKYYEIKNLDNDEFFKLLTSLNNNFNNQLDKINKELKLKNIKNNIILKDSKTSKKNLIFYTIFLIYFNHLYEELKIIKKKLKLNFKKYEGLSYRLIMNRALDDVKSVFKRKYFIFPGTIWDKMKFKNPIGPHIPFNREFKKYFKTFEINELNKRSYFLQYEKIKLTYNIINDSIDIINLLNLGLIKDYFPLHDTFIINKLKKENYFSKIFKINKNNDLKKLNNFLKKIDKIDSIDFNKNDELNKIKFKFNFSIQPIKNYFGEKIALYFEFAKFLSNFNYFMMIIFTPFIIYFYFIDYYYIYFALKYINVFMINTFFALFFKLWKRKENLFILEHGQINFKEKENEIPSFKGNFIRDICSNNYNIKFYSSKKRKLKYIFSIIFSIIIILISILITINLLFLREYWNKNDYNKFWVTIFPSISITSLNYILNRIFTYFVVKINFYENHKNQTEFDNSLILKLFCFNFFNSFNQFFIIAFIKPNYTGMFGKCVNGCFYELKNQVLFSGISHSVLSLTEILIPFLFIKFRKFINKGNIFKSKWYKIDKFILNEKNKSIYKKNHREIEGTINDYMQLIIQFSFLCLFSITNEIIFVLAWITDILQIHFDKIKLFKLKRRPIPKGISNIGIWKEIMKSILYISIFINSSIFIFVIIENLKFENHYKINKYLNFVYLILSFILINKIIDYLISDYPSNYIKLLKRHENWYERLLNLEKKDGFFSLKKTGIWMDFNIKNNKLKIN